MDRCLGPVGLASGGFGRRRVAHRLEALDHGRRHVQPARFQHLRHQRKPRRQIIRRQLRRFPQAVMRGHGTIMAHPREMETDMQSKDAFDVAVIDTPEDDE